MTIPENLILFWHGTHAGIPSNWARETTLDDKFIRAWSDSIAPNNTGGADTHSHSGASHNHSMSAHSHTATYPSVGTTSENTGGSNTGDLAQVTHGHNNSALSTINGGTATDTIAWPTSSNNNRPPYHELILIKALTGAYINEDIIALWNSTTLPVDWLACTDGGNGAPALGNKYARGATTSGNSGGTGGSLTHTHDLAHTHSTSHYHSGQTGTSTINASADYDSLGGAGDVGRSDHYHNVNTASQVIVTATDTFSFTSGTVEPAYRKLLAIQRLISGQSLPKGLIGLWLGSTGSIPAGWLLCDGRAWTNGEGTTPDMRDKFLKFANAVGEIGNTGGAHTHNHPEGYAHTHTGASHNHGNGAGASFGGIAQHYGTGASSPNRAGAHSNHSISSLTSTTVAWASSTMNTNGASVNNEPPYRTTAFIQLEVSNQGAFLSFM